MLPFGCQPLTPAVSQFFDRGAWQVTRAAGSSGKSSSSSIDSLDGLLPVVKPSLLKAADKCEGLVGSGVPVRVC